MIAVDANIFLRLMLRDDDEAMTQSGLRLLGQGGVFVATTVVLESHWFMRKRLKKARTEVASLLLDALRTDGIKFQEPELVFCALDATKVGVEFDDALHVLHSPPDAPYASFDHDLVRRAPKADFPVSVFIPESPAP